MTKVHPNGTQVLDGGQKLIMPAICVAGSEPMVLTVWKKSLLMSCSGFTVFDSKGNLVFRVDSYLTGSRSQVILMDAAGKPLFTFRRKKLSLGDNWLVFDGETTAAAATTPRFAARKRATLLSTKCLAQVSSGSSSSTCENGNNNNNGNGWLSPNNKNIMYEVEGSYAQRCCAILDRNKRRVAEIKRKEAVAGVAFGGDVFRLVVQPGMDPVVAMAIVILLDQMFEPSR